jgi:hypothetical protein
LSYNADSSIGFPSFDPLVPSKRSRKYWRHYQ